MSGKWKKYYLVTEMDVKGFVHVRYHLFSMDIKNGWYRSAMSFNAFFHSSKARNRSKHRLFTEDYFASSPMEHVKKNIANGTKVVEHKTLWDFYKAIGYDYKSKKFI